MGRSDGFRESLQPLVRDAAAQGLSVNALTAALRDTYGHAYRRADLLEDLRRYRSRAATNTATLTISSVPSAMNAAFTTAVATFDALPGYFDFRHTIARAGVVAFAVSLLLPTLLTAAPRVDHGVLVAGTNELRANALTMSEFALPNRGADDQRARRTVAVPEPTPAPTPVPTPAPFSAPAQVAAGGPGLLVTASWYGPGFYENRLPCWPWLKANGLPIQFLPDTWGVAHKTLPCGTMLILTHGANTITVPVVDRGPYIAGREIDMSPRIKSALGCTDLCTVLMQIRQ